MPEIVAEPEEKQEQRQLSSMSLLQHLEELRRRIIYSVAAVAAGSCVGWWFAKDKIYPLMEKPILVVFKKYHIDHGLTYLNPLAPFNMYLKIGLMAGIFIACPVILYQIWQFISPGLYRLEKGFIFPFLFLSVWLFVSGGFILLLLVFFFPMVLFFWRSRPRIE